MKVTLDTLTKDEPNEIINSDDFDLNRVFESNASSYYGIVKETKILRSLLLFIQNDTYINKSKDIMISLTNLILKCPHIATVLSLVSINSPEPQTNLGKILINVYLSNNSSQDLRDIVYSLLKTLIENSSINHSLDEEVFQSLARKYYHPVPNEKATITKEDFDLHSNLLMLIYQRNMKINEECYIYFTARSKLNIELDQKIKIGKGYTVVFWLYNQYSYEELKQIASFNEKEFECNLVAIKTNVAKFDLILHNYNSINAIIKDNSIKKDCSIEIKERKWYQFSLKMQPNNQAICLSVKDKDNNEKVFKWEGIEDFQSKEEIVSIELFNNYIGRVKDIFILNDSSDEMMIPFDFGFCSSEEFMTSLGHSYPQYYQYAHKDTMIVSKELIDKIVIGYVPLYSNKGLDAHVELNNICNNHMKGLIESLALYANGIHINYKQFEYIDHSLKCLIPLLELIVNSNVLLDSTNEVIMSFFIIAKTLFVSSNCTIVDESVVNFFSSIGLLLKKLPFDLFTPSLLDCLMEFPTNLFDQYFKYIIFCLLFNSAIENKLCVWENYLQIRNTEKMHLYIPIKDLCVILKHFDNNRYDSFCCEAHSSFIDYSNELKKQLVIISKDNIKEEEIPIRSPQMNIQIKPIMKIIQMIIDYPNTSHYDSDVLQLMNQLTFDNSPCLQLALVNVFVNYFSNEELMEYHTRTLTLLLKNRGIEITMFVYCHSTLDVKCEMVKLFSILSSSKYSKNINDYLENNSNNNKNLFTYGNIIEMIKENITMKVSRSQSQSLSSLLEEKKKKSHKMFEDISPTKKETKTNTVTATATSSNVASGSNLTSNNSYPSQLLNATQNIGNFLFGTLGSIANTILKKEKIDEILPLNQYSKESNLLFGDKTSLSDVVTFTRTDYSEQKEKNPEVKLKEKEKEKDYLLRIRYEFYSIDYKNEHQIKYVYCIYNELIKWLSLSIECSIVNHKRVQVIVETLLKLLTEFKHIELIHQFIQQVLFWLNDNKYSSICLLNYPLFLHWYFETMLHISLSMKKEKFISSFIIIKETEANKLKELLTNVSKEGIELLTKLQFKDTQNNEDTLINFINSLKSWNVYQRESYAKTEGYSYYIDEVISTILNELNNKLCEDIAKVTDTEIKAKLYERYFSFSISSFEFSTYHLHYNNQTNKIDKTFLSESNKYFIPSIQKKDKKEGTSQWGQCDYVISLYNKIKHLWDYKQICSLLKEGVDNDKGKQIKAIVNYYLSNENKKYHCSEMEVLLLQHSTLFAQYLKIISQYLLIMISLSNQTDIAQWLKEYKELIIFCLIIDLILNDKINKNDQETQTTLMEIVTFSFYFFFKQNISSEDFIVISETHNDLSEAFAFITYFISEVISQNATNDTIPKVLFKEIISKATLFQYMDLVEILNVAKNDYSKDTIIELYKKCNSQWEKFFFSTNTVYKSHMSSYFNRTEYEMNLNKQMNISNQTICLYKNDPALKSLMLDSESISKTELLTQKKIENIIKDIYTKAVNFFELYSYSEEIAIRKRIKGYIQTKKELFKWNSSWSNKELFFNSQDRLKKKLKNHYTSEYTKPLLEPIIDMKYYLPHFPKFSVREYFRNDICYQIDLNIAEMIGKPNKTELIKKAKEKKLNKQLKAIYACCGFNYWPSTKAKSNSRINCCLIKISQHIKGFFELTQDYIVFTNINFALEPNSLLTYDPEKKSCIGSFIINTSKDYTYPQKEIRYEDIVFILKKRYFYRNSNIEIFTNGNKCYLFNFERQEERDKVILDLTPKCLHLTPFKIGNDIIGYITESSPYKSLQDIMSQWVDGSISTMKYVMLLNLLSSRSYHDITQYPVFPWTIVDYGSQALPSTSSSLRDFSRSVGMLKMENNQFNKNRRKDYKKNFKDKINLKTEEPSECLIDNTSSKAYCFGSHYSNPLYTTHYLARLFPFPQIMVELQGNKFDDPNRLFLSMKQSFNCVSSQNGDLRELIPEFFYLPEMYMNCNDLNLGKYTERVTKEKILVENVELPPWCNSHSELVSIFRENLEKECSDKINKWIDLIFGYKQRGEKAEAVYNIFMPHCYENNVKIDDIKTQDEKLYYMRLNELGVVPNQIILNESPSQSLKPKGSLLSFKQLITVSIDLNCTNGLYPIAIEQLSSIDKTKTFMVIMSNLTSRFIDINQQGNKFVLKYDLLNQDVSLLSPQLVCPISLMSVKEIPIKQINSLKAKQLVIGGYLDGRILVSKIVNNIKFESHFIFNYIYRDNTSNQIIAIEIDQGNKFIYLGSKSGTIFIYGLTSLSQISSLSYHKKEITSLSSNSVLNLFASASYDGMVYVYSALSFKIVQSIRMSQSHPDKVFLSSSPLPCIVLYCNETNSFYSYSINGQLIVKIKEEDLLNGENVIMVTPMIYKDQFSCEYLVIFL